MALIKCPECGHNISTWAIACPSCGVPQEIIKILLIQQEISSDQENPSPSEISEDRSDGYSDQSLLQMSGNLEATVSKAKSVISDRTVKCTACKNSFNTGDSSVCPHCNYPVMTFNPDKSKEEKLVQAYRKRIGIQVDEWKVGQHYKLGRYHGEEIVWRILAVDHGKALLISEKGLDQKKYHDKAEPVTWETCSLRKWLNREFFRGCFDLQEQKRILNTSVPAEWNPKSTTDPGASTNDKVFLLSIQEAEKYFTGDEDRKASPTEYAKNNGARISDSTKCCWWWLRSPGRSSLTAASVFHSGGVREDGYGVYYDLSCVRPALWVKLYENNPSIFYK